MCPDCVNRQARMESMAQYVENIRLDFVQQRARLDQEISALRMLVGTAPQEWMTATQAAEHLGKTVALFRYEWRRYHRQDVRAALKGHRRFWHRDDIESWARSA